MFSKQRLDEMKTTSSICTNHNHLKVPIFDVSAATNLTIRHFMIIVFTWWHRTSSKFTWEKVKRQWERLGYGRLLSGLRFVRKTKASSWLRREWMINKGKQSITEFYYANTYFLIHLFSRVNQALGFCPATPSQSTRF